MAHTLAVWCLVLAMPIYGLTGTIVQLLGAGHVHRASVSRTIPNASLKLEDFRRAGAATASVPASVEQPIPHAHAVFQRHHHAATDVTVIALGGREDDGVANDSPASAGAACHVLAPCTGMVVPYPSYLLVAWLVEPTRAVAALAPHPLDRPPKA